MNKSSIKLELQNKSVKSLLPSVSCFGAVVLFDHPKVYLEIDPAKGSILCPYCNKEFVLITHDNKTSIR